MLEATMLGIIKLASYDEAEKLGFRNYTAHCFTIICIVTDNAGTVIFREPINNILGEETAIWGLEREYYYYQQYGYKTGEIMKLEEGEKIIQTDPSYIYD